MIRSISLSLLAVTLLSPIAQAAKVHYLNNPLQCTSAVGVTTHPWVWSTNMWTNLSTSSGSASSQEDFSMFDAVYDITKLTWSFGNMPLYNGAGTSTLSPGAATAGFEDYRTSALGNLNVYYDGALWATGTVTRFVTRVDNNTSLTATGIGYATLDGHTALGTQFYNSIMAMSGQTGEVTFYATSFRSTDPGNGMYESDGYFEVIPEPSTTALAGGALALGIAALIRRRRK